MKTQYQAGVFLDQKAQKLLKAGKTENYAEAMKKVMDANPVAAKVYLQTLGVEKNLSGTALKIDRIARKYLYDGKYPTYQKCVQMVLQENPDWRREYLGGD